jgi:hypothetical protein
MKKYFSKQKLNDMIYEWIENPRYLLLVYFAFIKSGYKGLTAPSKTWVLFILLVIIYLLFRILNIVNLCMSHFFTTLQHNL